MKRKTILWAALAGAAIGAVAVRFARQAGGDLAPSLFDRAVITRWPWIGGAHLLPLSTAIMAGGLAIEAMGLYLAILARRHLGRYWSGEISIKVDHRLIRSGPYQKLRHPIYTGLLAMYAGAAVVTGTWLALAGFAMALFAYARKIRLEEQNLRVAFGAEYEAYRRESWALVPGLF
jgi:protein-S-isoprenylcysteine O-methyltransferase Ste14